MYAKRPGWARGSVSKDEGDYLHERAAQANSDVVVEVGTASGVSTAVLAAAVNGKVFTYDLYERFYDDPARAVGDAAKEMLDPDDLARVIFRNPATALDAAKEHTDVGFVFIDADHQHPWPCLDLLALLESLVPGAEVVLHDINLPVKWPEFPEWGAKWLYDELDLPKLANHRDPVPNIGSVFIPEDKGRVREEIVAIIHSHEWTRKVPPEVSAVLLGGE